MPDESLTSLSDADLLARVQRGGEGAERAFEAVYFRSRGFVHRVARRFAGDDESALDAAQEVFAHLLRTLPRLKLTGKLSTYLYPVAKSCAISQRRKMNRQMPGVGPLSDDHGEFPSAEQVDAAGEHVRLHAAVAGLPDAQREVLLMRVVDEMSVEQVAAALGVPAGTVKSRLFHALAALREREELRRYWEEG